MTSRTRTIAAALLTAALIVAGTGCGADRTDDQAQGSGVETPTGSEKADAGEKVEEGPWTDYGLPAPGSEGTGVTVSRGKVRLLDRENLQALSAAEIEATMKSLTDLYELAYWDLAKVPVNRQKPHMYDRYLDAGAAGDFNAQAKEDGATSFGTYNGGRDGFYQFKIYDIQVVALESYPNTDTPGAGPVAHLRTYFKASWTGLPAPEGEAKKKDNKPKKYQMQAKVDGWFSNVDDDPVVEMIGWADNNLDIETTPIKKVG